MSRILKTLHIPTDSDGRYVTINFQNLDFMPIENTHLNELDFTLLNHSEEEISFRKTIMHTDTHINLVFKHFPVQ